MSVPAAGYRALDRYLVPTHRRELARYVTRTLLAAHGRGERVQLGAARAWPMLGPRPRPADGGTAAALLQHATRRLRGLDAHGLDWVLLHAHGEERGRALAYGFAEGAREPHAVLKLRRRDAGGATLAHERDVTTWAGARLRDGSVPSVLAYGSDGVVEALLVEVLPGRSAYVELRNSLVPAWRVRAHFEAAAGWLARFHAATRAPRRLDPARDLDGTPPALLEDVELPSACGVHGDFWARNVLRGGDRVGVVDWEHARTEGPGHEDLFHFALSYALAWPGVALRPEDALRAAFVDDTPLSRALVRAAGAYGRALDVDPAAWRPLLRAWLRRGAPGPLATRAPWSDLAPLLEGNRCVFSG